MPIPRLESHHVSLALNIASRAQQQGISAEEATNQHFRIYLENHFYQSPLTFLSSLTSIVQIALDHPKTFFNKISIFVVDQAGDLPKMLQEDTLCQVCPNNQVTTCNKCQL